MRVLVISHGHPAFSIGGAELAEAERIDSENAALIARLRVSKEGQHGLTAFLDKRAPALVGSANG